MLNGASDSISICIATYRRPEGLARLLDSLLRLKIPPDVVLETIVSDHAPSDGANMLRMPDLPALLDQLRRIEDAAAPR